MLFQIHSWQRLGKAICQHILYRNIICLDDASGYEVPNVVKTNIDCLGVAMIFWVLDNYQTWLVVSIKSNYTVV